MARGLGRSLAGSRCLLCAVSVCEGMMGAVGTNVMKGVRILIRSVEMMGIDCVGK